MAKKKGDTSIQDKALNLIQDEKTEWETGTAFVTEKISFNMRNMIRQLRKNYYGIFDTPLDPQTGRKKIWIPLTESLVESAVKNIDLDTKDINFRAKHPDSFGLTHIIRSGTKNALDKMNFGEKLDMLERDLAIDGTAIWYTGEKKDKDGKMIPEVRRVDLLNFYIDPTADSIQEAEAVIERIILTEGAAKDLGKKRKWINQDSLVGTTNISRRDGEYSTGDTRGETRLVELYKRTGIASKMLITGKESDEDIEEHVEIVASGTNGKWVLHEIRKVPELKPYEEVWYTRVPGRWYGKGIAEKVMMLQIWMNTIVNIRINRQYVNQLGIFKIKRNRGITPQAITRLASNGAVLVNDQDDIEQMAMQDIPPSAYSEEGGIQLWAERVTSAFEAVTGEALPASTTATATVVQQKSATSQFTLIKEGLGMFLQRWLERHALPKIMKGLSRESIIRMTGDPEMLRQFDERIANKLVMNNLKGREGLYSPEEVELERNRVLGKLQAMGQDRYVELKEEIDPSEFDVEVYVTNEEFDKGIMSQNLIQVLQILPTVPGIDPNLIGSTVNHIMDLMGLPPMNLAPQPTQPQPQPNVGAGSQSPLDQFVAANTPQN